MRKILPARQSDIKALRPYVDRVLEAISVDQKGAVSSFVTDRSRIGDFYLVNMEKYTAASITQDEYDAQLAGLCERLGIKVVGTTLIVDAARQLKREEK